LTGFANINDACCGQDVLHTSWFNVAKRLPATMILTMRPPIEMRDGDALLVMVKDGRVLHYSWNMSLPHVEFVRRTTGTLPAGAWVGTVSKLDGEVMGITSKYFFDYQLPAPAEVNDAIRRTFR
jgi:hypothetical protein